MKYAIQDKKYHFISIFNTETGQYIRSNILNTKGHNTGIEPFMASFPHLIDIGIMGQCIHGQTGLCAKAGIGCYQSGMFKTQPNMTLENFQWIAEQCKGRCNQFALGGRGDPDQHEHFKEILQISHQNLIVPNFTTSGFGMTDEIAKICHQYCGAVAISWYRNDYTLNAIDMLIKHNVKTNIHFVLGQNSIDEAIHRLQTNEFPKGINAVIFLLHKPAGQGTTTNMLRQNDLKVKTFFELLDKPHTFKVGMDSCNVPGAIQYCKNIKPESLDTCEAARFSCYIGPDMIMVPCSFDQNQKYQVQLDKNTTIKKAWNSESFNQFRDKMQTACPTCQMHSYCLGGCPLMPEIVCCNKQERRINP